MPPSYGAPPTYGSIRSTPPGAGALAGFWRRLGGSILDGLLYGLAWLPFGIVGFVLVFGVGLGGCTTDPFTDEIVCNGNEEIGAIVAGVALMVAGWLVVAILYLRGLARSGQTWGRKLAGLRVVDARTAVAPGWGKAIGRTLFAGFISGNFCYLGYLWMLWDDRNQTWHDKVASTLVVES